MKVKVGYRQNFFDISIQEYGDVSYAFYLSYINNLSLTDTLVEGSFVEVPVLEVENELAQDYVKASGISPATAAPEPKFNPSPILRGIGFMRVGTTFKVY